MQDEEFETSHKGVIIAGLIALTAIIIGGGAIAISNLNSSDDGEDITSALSVRNNRTFELGDKVVLSASTFTNSKAMSEQEIAQTRVDSDLINTPSKYTYNTATKTVVSKDEQCLRVGKYEVKLTLNDETKTVDFSVKDTTPPQFTNWSDKIYIKQVEKEKEADFSKYFTVQDYAKTTISISPNKNEGTKKFDVTKAGEYYVIVTATDESGNKTEKECVIDVLAVDSSSNSLLMTNTASKILNNAEEIKKAEEEKKEQAEDESGVILDVSGEKANTSGTVEDDDEDIDPTPTPLPEPTPDESTDDSGSVSTSTILDQNVYNDASGNPLQGKNTVGGVAYYFVDGVKQPGWQYQNVTNDDGNGEVVNYYLCDAQTGEMYTGWYTDSAGNKYWFGPEGDYEDCRMRTGSVVMDGTRYTFGEDGVLKSQESTKDADDTTGSRLSPTEAKDPDNTSSETQGSKGSVDPTDTNVYKDADGNPYQGLVKIENNTYYFADGIKQNGFVTSSATGNTYYLDPSNGSALSTGEIKVGDNWYLASAKGVIQKGVVYLTIKDSSGNTTNHRYCYDKKDGHRLYGYQSATSNKGNTYHYYFNDTTGEATYGFMTKYTNGSNDKYVVKGEAAPSGYTQVGDVFFDRTTGRQVESGSFQDGNTRYTVENGIIVAAVA